MLILGVHKSGKTVILLKLVYFFPLYNSLQFMDAGIRLSPFRIYLNWLHMLELIVETLLCRPC